jgi:hypothetical protein
MPKDEMTDLDPSLEQRLADLSDVDWEALTARVRPPTSAAQLKEIAGKVISGDKLDAFVNVANLKALADENGDIDSRKVQRALRVMFDIPDQAAHQNFGQFSPQPDMGGPGDRGKAEAQKRFRIGQNGEPPPARGGGGAAEAARRFGKREG